MDKSFLSFLNQRLFAIRRISNHIPRDKVRQILNSLWISKLRYGLQQTVKVRLTEEDNETEDMKAAQKDQNQVQRLIDRSRIEDKRSVGDILEKFPYAIDKSDCSTDQTPGGLENKHI